MTVCRVNISDSYIEFFGGVEDIFNQIATASTLYDVIVPTVENRVFADNLGFFLQEFSGALDSSAKIFLILSNLR